MAGGSEARVLVILQASDAEEISDPDLENSRYLVAQVTAGDVEALLPKFEVLARIPLSSPDVGAEQLARHLSKALAATAPDGPDRQDPHDPYADAALLGSGATFTSPTTRRRQRLLQAAFVFIDQHLHEPRLAPTGVASAIHVSARYLHAIFRESGTTVAQHIRKRRLEVGREMLAQPSMAGVHIADIARRVGFTDPSHFARVFRVAYGQTPREFRVDTFTSFQSQPPPEPPSEPAT